MGALDFGPFEKLDPGARERLAANGREVKVVPGEPLIREKSAASGCYVLLEGTLRIVRQGRTVRMLIPPTVVGEIGTVMGKPRNASVVADTASTVLFLPIMALRETMADHPKFAAALREQIALRLAEAHD